MWQSPPAPNPATARRRVPVVAVAFTVVTVLAAVDVLGGAQLVILGTLTTGPCLAAGSARSRAVLAVGAYVILLVTGLCWWPDRLWGSARHLLFTLIPVVVTAVGVVIARQLRAVERARVQAENEWRALAAIVAHSDDAIVAADLDGRLSAFNRGAERLYGYPADDVLGRAVEAFHALVTPDDAPGPSHAELVTRIANGEQGIRFESRKRHRDGTGKEVSVVVSPVRDEAGEMVGISWVTRDISAQRRAEERAQQAQRMASLGQLAGGVAHDFNNILGIMLSFTTFAEECSTDPAVRADLVKARLAGERAVDLTRQLLTFTCQDTVHPQAVDLNAGIAELCAMLTRTIDKKIELIADPAAPPLMIYADAGQVQQILLNLAVNARDAMPDGGRLTIEATEAWLDENQQDLHPAPAPGRYVRLRVSDTGTGMSAEVASRVFEPFYTTKPKGHGTGLGLATVYGIVREAGGSINVYSEPGLGTTFRVYFPAAPADATVAPPVTAAVPRAGYGQTVLVVEDEAELGEAVVRILRNGGYRTRYARGGAAALVLAAAQGCDLLLTDIIMPGMSGRELAKLILADQPDLPVLYMSGYSDGLVGTTELVENGTAFIEKPFTADDLLARVGAILRAGELPARHPAGPAAVSREPAAR